MDETFSSIDLVTQCLLDSERTGKFEKAIEEVVRPRSVVLDAGTGSGVLSLFAARAGAGKVYSVECDPYVAKLARQNFFNNGYGDTIEIHLGDVRNMDFAKGVVFDVVIMEMLTTGMVDEYQVWSINNLFKKGYVNENTKFIPGKQDTFVSLAETDFKDYSFDMRMVKHFWKFLPRPEMLILTDTEHLSSVLFNKPNEINFKEVKTFSIKQNGVLNSIYLSSKTYLTDSIELGDTLALNAPVVYPLQEDLEVNTGDIIKLSVEYDFGNGYRNLKVNAHKI